MKKSLLLLCLFIAFTALGQHAPKLKYKTIKTYVTDLNSDNRADTVTISSSVKEDDAFNRVAVSLAGYGTKKFIAKYEWTLVDTDFLARNKNAINSKFLYIKKSRRQSAILLFGVLDGAGYREEFSIINVENNAARLVFGNRKEDDDIDVEIPIAVKPLAGNNRLCFIFTGYNEVISQSNNPAGDIVSYVPFTVYTIDEKCMMNKRLTKQYNQQHYVFAGYGYDERVRIFRPKNGGKPRVWKGKD
jgi:hypothetical protein